MKDFLQQVFDLKRKVNSRYSLRSFAKFLNISPSMLSQILSGKYSITPKTESLILRKLSSNENYKVFVEKYVSENDITQQLQPYLFSKQDFESIQKWYFPIVLNYMTLVAPQSCIAELCKLIHISDDEFHRLMKLLVDSKLVTWKNNRWNVNYENMSSLGIKNTTQGLIDIQKNFCEFSKEQILINNFDRRDNSVMVIKTKTSDLSYAKEEILKFRRKLATQLEKRSKNNSDCVAVLAISLNQL